MQAHFQNMSTDCFKRVLYLIFPNARSNSNTMKNMVQLIRHETSSSAYQIHGTQGGKPNLHLHPFLKNSDQRLIKILTITPFLNQTFVPLRFMSQGRHPTPKIPPSKLMQHYDIHGTISDDDSAKQFVFALSTNERKRLLTELESFRDLQEKITWRMKVDQASKPSRQQLKQVALHQAFPFIGFGFLDNLLMICFGEYIDVTLGAAFGISTMAAAAFGNLLSDVGGIGSASYVENIVSRLGVRAPRLSPEQVEMKSTRWASSLGKAIGVTIGCLLGMFPLLFFSAENKEKEKNSTNEK